MAAEADILLLGAGCNLPVVHVEHDAQGGSGLLRGAGDLGEVPGSEIFNVQSMRFQGLCLWGNPARELQPIICAVVSGERIAPGGVFLQGHLHQVLGFNGTEKVGRRKTPGCLAEEGNPVHSVCRA